MFSPARARGGGNTDPAPAARGRGRGRGTRGRGGGGRGGGAPSGGTGGMEEFIPSTLGIALVEGYDAIGFENSLSKPFLSKEMEVKMKAICEGRMDRAEVVGSSIVEYREMFAKTAVQVGVLRNMARFYCEMGGVGERPVGLAQSQAGG